MQAVVVIHSIMMTELDQTPLFQQWLRFYTQYLRLTPEEACSAFLLPVLEFLTSCEPPSPVQI